MFNPYFILAVLLALIGSAVSGYSMGYDTAENAYKAEILSLQNDANKRLAEKTREALEATEKQIKTAQQLDLANNEANQKIDAAMAANRALKLRYRSTAPRCGTMPESSPTSIAADQPDQVEFELPRAITDDLFGLAASADRVSNYADLCYRWVKSMR